MEMIKLGIEKLGCGLSAGDSTSHKQASDDRRDLRFPRDQACQLLIDGFDKPAHENSFLAAKLLSFCGC